MGRMDGRRPGPRGRAGRRARTAGPRAGPEGRAHPADGRLRPWPVNNFVEIVGTILRVTGNRRSAPVDNSDRTAAGGRSPASAGGQVSGFGARGVGLGSWL